MALLDLSQVTDTLIRLLATRVQAFQQDWPGGVALDVVPLPPDKLTGDNTLGLYLYHVTEDAHYKNMPPVGDSQLPIRHAPLPLCLYYLLCAHSDLEGAPGAYREQLMMGLAMKTLHDHPVVNDETQVVDRDGNAVIIMPLGLHDRNNRFQIALRPLPVDQAAGYWTAGSSPLRLAAYYAVSVVMLEPEEPPTRTGRVFTYNVFAFPGETPRIDSSSNEVSFTPPWETRPRTITLRPAQAPVGGQVRFEGSNLAGDQTTLLLHHARWADPVAVEGLAWSVQANAGQVTAVVQATAGAHELVPGIYGASVQVSRGRAAAGGGSRVFQAWSNEAPFAIAPSVAAWAISDPATGAFTITGRLFAHADLRPDDVHLVIGVQRLRRREAGAALEPGEFIIHSSTEMRGRLPAGLPPGQAVVLRLLVNGIEAPPVWIRVP